MPNISLRTPHRAKKATSVSSDRAPHALPHRELRHTPRDGKNAPLPRAKKTRNNRPQPPSFLPIPSSFFSSLLAPEYARTLRAHQSVFKFHLHPFTLPSQLPVDLQNRCEGFAPGNFTFASPDFCTKSPCRNNLHRMFSHGELCMNVNASPFYRRSAVRFNGLAREGEG